MSAYFDIGEVQASNENAERELPLISQWNGTQVPKCLFSAANYFQCCKERFIIALRYCFVEFINTLSEA